MVKRIPKGWKRWGGLAPGLGISGRFTVVERINNAREATTAWANRRT